MSIENHSKNLILVERLVANIIKLGATHGLSLEDLPTELTRALQQIDSPDPTIQTQGLTLLDEFLGSDEAQQIADMLQELPTTVEMSDTPVIAVQSDIALAIKAALKPRDAKKPIVVEDQKFVDYSRFQIAKTVRKDVAAGRNDPCPCGSGKKYKKCCGSN